VIADIPAGMQCHNIPGMLGMLENPPANCYILQAISKDNHGDG